MKSYRLRERAHAELIHDLLHGRGIAEGEESARFLEPDYLRDSHDPFLLPDMGPAVERIMSAAKNNEQIAVWSDYDCDGIPGGVMLAEFLRSLNLSVRHYIPHRHDEGYGLNSEGIDELAGQKISLIITVDLGSSDLEPITHAKKKGIDVIVTDHHLLPAILPPAFAIINPKRAGSRYPFQGLCGAGVAWKLVQELLLKQRPEGFTEGREKWLLDLVGMATLSDRVPLVGENRMLARFGLLVMRKNRRPGFAALLRMLRIEAPRLTEDDIGFMIAPRINAASRMDAPGIAARLLATQDREEAGALALELQSLNNERKGVVAATVKEAKRRIAESEALAKGIIVMGSPNWRPGILGLVANSLSEAEGKPVCLWGREGGNTIRGSCRSDGSVNVVEMMRRAGDLFLDFGGHMFSGGFSLQEEKIFELTPRLVAAYETLRAQDFGTQEIMLDRELPLEEISFASRDLMKLAPFGEGNAKPLFLLPGVSIAGVRSFGKSGDHLEITLARADKKVSAISFFNTPDSFEKKPVVGMRADIVGHVENGWNGRPRVRVVDVL